MKLNLFRPLGLAVFIALCGISNSCSNASSETETSTTSETKTEEVVVAEYSCPMKCEKDKTHAHEGQCPVCEMDLKQIN